MKGQYGQSEHGNFKVIDTIGVPHPYCIMPKHVSVAADHHSGILDEAAIIDAESRGAKCGTCKGKLSYKEHEQALLVGCKLEIKDAAGMVCPELHQYLLTIKDEATKNGYAGFAFKKGF